MRKFTSISRKDTIDNALDCPLQEGLIPTVLGGILTTFCMGRDGMGGSDVTAVSAGSAISVHLVFVVYVIFALLSHKGTCDSTLEGVL